MKLKVGPRHLLLPLTTRFLLVLFLFPLAWQVWMAQQVDVTVVDRRTTMDRPKVPSLSTNSSRDSSSNPHRYNQKKPPKVFIGIMGDSSRQLGLEYRNKQRQLFAIWNDTRLCHLTKALQLLEEHGGNIDNNNDDCQVIYSFIVGGHDSSSSVFPYHLGKEDDDDVRSLTLPSIPLLPRFKDVNGPDVTILNIRENMNEGKTPTFVHFALQKVAHRLGVSYIVKCDSDATLRWSALLRFLHMEFPTPPISTVIGMFRHKAFWLEGRPEDEGEQLWNQEWYGGMHLYLAGQLYVMSVDVAERLVEEAQRWYTPTSFVKAPYFAGHEDHDALSLVQQPPQPPRPQKDQQHPEYTATNIIRWVGIAKHVTFWEHPVKGEGRWERILNRERTQAKERLEGTRPGLFTANHQYRNSGGDSGGLSSGNYGRRWRPSLVVLFLESSSNITQQRETYLEEWTRRNGGGLDRVCGFSSII